MALINCIECNREVSDKAASCPNCGCPIASVESSKGKLYIYGYKENFVINSKVKIYRDNEYIGEIDKGRCLEIDILSDCVITAKCSIRSNTYNAKANRNSKIQLSFDRLSGKLNIFEIDFSV